MLKLIRQYNQWILVVGGTLLLVTFLMPSAIQNCAQRSAVSGSVWATYSGGREATGAELEQAQQELRVLELMRDPTLTALGADRDPAHWWLLAHEAAQAGLVAGPNDAEALLLQSSAGGPQEGQQAIFNMAKQSGTNRDIVLAALGKLSGVQRLVSLAVTVDRVSDRRLAQSVAQSMLGVSGDVVVLDARTNATVEVPAPTEEALAAQLAKYGDKPAPADDKRGLDNFGYRIPDRFKLEWIVISKASIAASVAGAPELASESLRKRFLLDPAKYGADAASNPPFEVYMATVESRTREELVERRSSEIQKFAADQLGLAQRALKREGAYFALPADWMAQMPSLSGLAETVSREYAIELPEYRSSGDAWMTVAELEAQTPLGRASTLKFGASLRTPQLVAGLKELSAPSLVAPFQLGIASPAFVADNGDICFVRAIAAEVSRAPKGVDEVRDQLVRDVASVERYRALVAREAELASEAAAGIRPFADRFGASVAFGRDMREANPQLIGFGVRFPQGIPGITGDTDALAALVARAAKLPLTSTLADIPAAERTFVVAAPASLSIAVVQVTELSTVSIEQFQSLASTSPALVQVTRDPKLEIKMNDVFSLDALSKRHDFKMKRAAESIPTGGPAVPPL
ncbi:MAG: hypothetical protein ACKO0W_06370 [Planctomycetota bacterium]